MGSRLSRPVAARSRWHRSVVGIVAGLLMPFLMAMPASASEEEESDLSIDLVQQAISLIANDGEADRALEKMEDALMAPDPSGVDLALVEAAATLVEEAAPGTEEAALSEARELLLEAAPALAEAPEIEMARGLETGTTVVLDPFQPARGISDGGDAVLLALAVLAIALGLWLSWRLRPHHTIRQLRRLGLPEPRAAKQEGTS